MSDFTYSPPESAVFLDNLRQYLQAIDKQDVAQLLLYATYDVSSDGQFSYLRWDSYNATVTFLSVLTRFLNFLKKLNKTYYWLFKKFFLEKSVMKYVI